MIEEKKLRELSFGERCVDEQTERRDEQTEGQIGEMGKQTDRQDRGMNRLKDGQDREMGKKTGRQDIEIGKLTYTHEGSDKRDTHMTG